MIMFKPHAFYSQVIFHMGRHLRKSDHASLSAPSFASGEVSNALFTAAFEKIAFLLYISISTDRQKMILYILSYESGEYLRSMFEPIIPSMCRFFKDLHL